MARRELEEEEREEEKMIPRERMKELHFWSRMAREEEMGGDGRDEEMESRAMEERMRRKEEARGARAPKVSRANGTRREEGEVEVAA